MKYNATLILAVAFPILGTCAEQPKPIPNRLIDYPEFRKIVMESELERRTRRISEKEFLTLMAKPEAVLLDARSAANYKLRHIKGAVNLPFTEFTADTLKKVIPSKDAPVLIYCNNNFLGSPRSFASKAPAASLNLSTYSSLKAYGYTNIFELGPLLNVQATRLPFEGLEVQREATKTQSRTHK